MPDLGMRFEALPHSSCPSKAIEARGWLTVPMTARKVAVLPAPLRPSSVTSSPSPTLKFMPCRICDSPYQACRSRTWSSSLPVTTASGMTGPHISLDDLGVLRHLGIGALREDLAAGQHGDGVREVGHHREVVLDHQHGAVRRDLPDELRD